VAVLEVLGFLNVMAKRAGLVGAAALFIVVYGVMAAWELRPAEVSEIKITADPGFRTGPIRGERLELRVHNPYQDYELKWLDISCTLQLRNGSPGETIKFRSGFAPRLPPASSGTAEHPLTSLAYHVSEYRLGRRSVECEALKGRTVRAPRISDKVLITDGRCRLLHAGRQDRAQVEVLNRTDRTIESLKVECWSGTRWRTLEGLYRQGAPLNELVPPGERAWLNHDPPCLNDYTVAQACRVKDHRSR
jgi:hypothetical protein